MEFDWVVVGAVYSGILSPLSIVVSAGVQGYQLGYSMFYGVALWIGGHGIDFGILHHGSVGTSRGVVQ